MRKILYSPGYGAGWSSWNSGKSAKYMLEYQPIIEAIENGEKLCIEDKYSSSLLNEEIYHPSIIQLIRDCKEKFGEDIYVGGAEDLCIKYIEDYKRVRIHEYDGFESVEVEGEYDGWM